MATVLDYNDTAGPPAQRALTTATTSATRTRARRWWRCHKSTAVPVTLGVLLLVAPLLGAGQLGVAVVLQLAALPPLLVFGGVSVGIAATLAFALRGARRSGSPLR